MTLRSPRIQASNLLFLLFLSLTLTPQRAHSSDFQSPRTVGLGGSGHAAPVLNDTIYLNPAHTSFTAQKSLSANYFPAVSPTGGSSQTGGGLQTFNFSILDGSSDLLFQAGIAFTRRVDATLIHAGASKGYFNKIGVGVGSKIIMPNDGTGRRLADGSLSFSLMTNSWLNTAFTIDNLFESAPQFGFYREYTIGTKINLQGLVSIYFDPTWTPNLTTPTKQSYSLGLEFSILRDFSLRFGKFQNSVIPHLAQRGDGYGLGFGWMAPKLSLDYALSRVTAPNLSSTHHFGLTIYF